MLFCPPYCANTALPEEVTLSFACSIFAFSRKILHESSKIFVEHAQHVAFDSI